MTIDEWVDLEPDAHNALTQEPVVFGTIQLRETSSPKASISFEEAIAAAVGWPRYRVQWNPSRHAFRIEAKADGKFEGLRPPKSTRVVVRAPLPPQVLHLPNVRVGVSHRLEGKVLFVTVPSKFWAVKP